MTNAIQRRAGNVRTTALDFGISPNVLRAAITNGELHSYKAGGKTVILYEDVTAWLRRQEAPRAWRRRVENQTTEKFHEYVPA